MLDITRFFDRTVQQPGLAPEEESALVAQVRAGSSEAFARLAQQYAPRLRAAAARARCSIEDREERQQAALTAFHSAVLATAPGQRVATVITLTMTAAMHRTASESRRGLSVPHGTARRYFAILGDAHGDLDSARALAPTSGMSAEVFESVRAAVRGDLSIEAMTAAGGSDAVDDRTTGARSAPEGGGVETMLLARDALAAVDGVERTVTLLAYGFAEEEPVPDAEIAHRLGINRSSAWKIKQRALTRMRDRLGV
jgi:DNA-directed RNA polymerase specialized sigma subunit